MTNMLWKLYCRFVFSRNLNFLNTILLFSPFLFFIAHAIQNQCVEKLTPIWWCCSNSFFSVLFWVSNEIEQCSIDIRMKYFNTNMIYFQEKQDKLSKHRDVSSKSKEENDMPPSAKRSRHTLTELNYDGDHELSFSTTPRRSDVLNQLLNRPQVLVQRPVSYEWLGTYICDICIGCTDVFVFWTSFLSSHKNGNWPNLPKMHMFYLEGF